MDTLPVDILSVLGAAASNTSNHPEEGCPYLYLVLNCHGNADFLSKFFELAPDAEYRPLFLGVDSDDVLLLSPYIIEISNHSSDFITWLMEAAHHFGFFYTASDDIDIQLNHWQSILIVETKFTADAALFRFYDGELFHFIVASLPLKDQYRFLEPCIDLYFQDEEARWQAIKPSKHRELLAFYNLKQTSNASHQLPAPAAAKPIQIRTLAFKINQWLWKSSPLLMSRYFEPAIEKIILESIETASTRFALDTEKQIGLFVFYCFQYHLQFFDHPEIIEQFERFHAKALREQNQSNVDRFLLDLHPRLIRLTFNSQ